MTGPGPGPGQAPPRADDRRAAGPDLTAMVFIAGRDFTMGSDHHYPEEGPSFRARVADFWIDAAPVTNAQFAAFVRATGYVTRAERTPKAADYPDAPAHLLIPASLVFVPPTGRRAISPAACWTLVPGADWRSPYGRPESFAPGFFAPKAFASENHPVVHIAYEDALAYARWTGKDLPSEAEWEFAARGGIEGAAFAWGSEFRPGGRLMANVWDGPFPDHHASWDGTQGVSAVGCYPPNGYGLYDMIGNVWEWTSDIYVRNRSRAAPAAVQTPDAEPASACHGAKSHPRQGRAGFVQRVVKGGSHLCAPNFCRRYRPAARQPQSVDTSTSHIGFRCVSRIGRKPPTHEDSHDQTSA